MLQTVLKCANQHLYPFILQESFTFFQATALYKLVAERGPWNSLSRWALESYLKGDVGKAFLLYSRMAELGYEIAQSNAAWILDKYAEGSMCMGESGFCTDSERHQRAHFLWWQASEQGNEHAALLIGDAYYYGRVRVLSFTISKFFVAFLVHFLISFFILKLSLTLSSFS
jgi:TPR repeat protein